MDPIMTNPLAFAETYNKINRNNKSLAIQPSQNDVKSMVGKYLFV